ncbi:hypothetical protein [Prauserella endophytica]|uniref:Uncharacterized protein n=1 Tax=Prauserella endophytica TaxID=1592324 RepID=A0ABY2S8K3_9PSEU|nr:hypothetical protein [Prauserella endophytica]TKG71639.1 hypothetical protein FCN18_12810 [Prauserella endophytica]
MLTKLKRHAARALVAAALIAMPAGMIATTPLASSQTDRETDSQQAWMIPFPGWWAGKVYCMTFPDQPGCGGGVIA